MRFARTIDTTIYPRGALADMRQAYRDFCSISVTPGNIPDLVDLTIDVREQYESNGRQIVLEAWNYLLDRACQIHFEHPT